jgi:hypothetical protein
MSQNKADIIKRFVGVASNTITHKILIKSELEEDIRKHYSKEISRDVEISLKYRNMINPVHNILPEKYAKDIMNKIVLKVKAELLKRADKGYNIDFTLVDKEIYTFLKECNIIE